MLIFVSQSMQSVPPTQYSDGVAVVGLTASECADSVPNTNHTAPQHSG